jgi:transketolase
MNSKSDAEQMRKLREKILRAAFEAKDGHIPSSLSVMDILYVLYVLLPREKNIDFQADDFFVLSKGHASLALYAILEEVGLQSDRWLSNFGKFESSFGGHPDSNKLNGVTASTGSLGHGLPFTLGKILAKRSLGRSCSAFCLVGDGEMNEGTTWESLLIASHHEMKELTLLIDDNGSTNRSLKLGDLESKFKSFGFETYRVDGHSHSEILSALLIQNSYPKAIIASTIKGYGVNAMENNPAWHHAIPNTNQLAEMVRDLK